MHQTIIIFAAVGVALLLLEAAWNFYGPANAAAFDNLFSLAVACPAIFFLVMKGNVPVHSKELAQYSTGIYLIHILVMSITTSIILLPHTVLTMTTAAISVIAAYFLIRLNRQVPYLL